MLLTREEGVEESWRRGEDGLSLFNISGDESNQMVEAKGFPQEW